VTIKGKQKYSAYLFNLKQNTA